MKTAGQSALYARNNDVSQYAGLLEKLMDDAELRSEMGQIGRQRIENGLTWDHQAAQLVKAYDGLFGIPRQTDHDLLRGASVNSSIAHQSKADRISN
jgi:hypothetical protein